MYCNTVKRNKEDNILYEILKLIILNKGLSEGSIAVWLCVVADKHLIGEYTGC